MIAIHPVHRRMAELALIGKRRRLTYFEQLELYQCIEVNANLVRQLDELKQLAFVAHTSGDMEWQQDLCRQIDEIEAKCI